MDYYTYAYLREDGTPYYIGKGRGKRVYDTHNRKSCKVPKNKNRILFLKKDLTEEEAFKHEIYMIAVFGRKDLETGILHNMTDGGEGFSSKQMKLFWQRRNKKKLEKSIKLWRKKYDKDMVWREQNRKYFDKLIRDVLSNRNFRYN